MKDRLYIPEYFQEEVEFNDASRWFNHWWNRPGCNDVLDKLIDFEKFYHQTLREIHGGVGNRYDLDDEFFEEYRWELNYFNKLFEGFSQLLAPKKEVA